jgi:hypothetical protein
VAVSLGVSGLDGFGQTLDCRFESPGLQVGRAEVVQDFGFGTLVARLAHFGQGLLELLDHVIHNYPFIVSARS